jgi:pSer/pThr/pTyr-binding forkhead associated (FHA) protein
VSAVTASVAVGPRWRLVVTIDPTLDNEPDPSSPPPTEPERIFPVEQDEMLVGRRDDRQQIRPAVALHDPGASRRHATILRNADGSLSLHDHGSMNGTQLNGQDVVSGAVRPLAEGDQITLGRWTRIRVEARK